MSDFRFKHFSVKNEDSPMKVGTDGVLLGAVVRLYGKEHRILDIGTGTGVIALMLAQRTEPFGSKTRITGIDIDPCAAREAAFNFGRSPWRERLEARDSSLEEFASLPLSFDLIVSNPPFFDNALQNPDPRRSEARHSVSLSYKDILSYAETHLSPDGTLAMILPSDCLHSLLKEARPLGFYASRVVSIATTARKPSCRIIVEFTCVVPESPVEESLILHDGNNYTGQYLDLVKDFYLFA